MKKNIFVLILFFLCIACSSVDSVAPFDQQQAKALIKESTVSQEKASIAVKH